MIQMFQDMMKNLKEFLITLVLFPMLGLNQSKYETPRWLGALDEQYQLPNLGAAQARIKVEEENRKNVQSQREIAADSLRKFQVQVLELDNNTEVAGELGPLQYLSGLTGISMDKIINWLLLIIIFVFDPLAISLVIAANFAFTQAYPKKKYRENLYGEKVEDKFSEWDNLEDIEVKDAEREDERKHWENITGQIQDGSMFNEEKFNILDLNKDGKISKAELVLNKIKQLRSELKLVTSKLDKNRIQKKITDLKIKLYDDDTTKTY